LEFIPNYKKNDSTINKNEIIPSNNTNLYNINELKNQLKNEKDQVKKLIEENTILKNEIKDKNKLENENKELKGKLNKSNKIIANKEREIQDLKNQINSIQNLKDNQINNLKNDIINKDKEINKLKKQIQNINFNKNEKIEQINVTDIKSVTIITADYKICYSIGCSGNATFAEIEEKLYKEYPEYR